VHPQDYALAIHKKCEIEWFASGHYSLLHKGRQSSNIVRSHQVNPANGEQYFGIVSIRVRNDHITFDSYAFLAEGSLVILMDDEFLKALWIHQPVLWTNPTTRMERAPVRFNIRVSGVDDNLIRSKYTYSTFS